MEFTLTSAVIGMSADLSLIGVIIGMSAQPLYPTGTRPTGEGIFLVSVLWMHAEFPSQCLG